MRTIPETPGPFSPGTKNVVMPITSPCESNNGPPELPWLIFTSEIIAPIFHLADYSTGEVIFFSPRGTADRKYFFSLDGNFLILSRASDWGWANASGNPLRLA